ncbi:hypothetical protein BJ944DRAFT_227048 [Cunninghamella echinulata]|nr:hypothetical protein BJ944DRAFT_227048 [Cunninghamella echinulata]
MVTKKDRNLYDIYIYMCVCVSTPLNLFFFFKKKKTNSSPCIKKGCLFRTAFQSFTLFVKSSVIYYGYKEHKKKKKHIIFPSFPIIFNFDSYILYSIINKNRYYNIPIYIMMTMMVNRNKKKKKMLKKKKGSSEND